jgi:hypothetical protein
MTLGSLPASRLGKRAVAFFVLAGALLFTGDLRAAATCTSPCRPWTPSPALRSARGDYAKQK